MRARGSGSIYRRGRVWWLKYYDRDGRARRESSRAENAAQAARLLRRRLGEVASGRRVIGADAERLSFEDLARLLSDDWRANERRSLERLSVALRNLARYFGGWRARDIDFGALQAYRAWRAREVSAATIRWELGALRRAFKLAARDGRAECPPFPEKLPGARTRRGFFEVEEWSAVRAHLPAEFQDVGDFAFLTGWRLMEILALRWAQVDLRAGTVRLEPGTTKTGEGRLFPFAEYPQLREVIERRRARREETQRAAEAITPWVFFFHQRGRFHAAGAPLFRGRRPSWAFRYAWKQAAQAAGLADRIPHDFRRTAARNMERAGVPRSVAMALGGWKTESMYRRYAIASEADLREAARLLGGLGTISGTVEASNARKSL